MTGPAGTRGVLAATGLGALVVLLAVGLPLVLSSGSTQGVSTQGVTTQAVSTQGVSPQGVSPQELVDDVARGGFDPRASDRPAELGDRPAADERAHLPEERLAAFADGPARATTDYRGAPLVVNFWASWCTPCVEEMPELDALAAGADGRVGVLGVNRADNDARAEALVTELGVRYDLAVDDDDSLFAAVDGFGMPTTLFVDAEGTIVHRRTGALSGEDFRTAIEQYLGVRMPR